MTVADLETLGHGEDGEQPPVDEKSGARIHGRSPTRIAFDRLRKDKIAVICAGLVLLLILLGVFAPLICKLWGIDPYDGEPGKSNSDLLQFGMPIVGPPYYPFTWSHPLGLSPQTAYDNLAQLLYGIRTSLAIAFAATLISGLIGVTVGLVAGYARGWLERVISFVIDAFLSFPYLLGAISISPIIASHFATEPSKLKWAQFGALVAVLVTFGWMQLARLIRGEVLSLREREFIQSALVIGEPSRRVMFKELLPNLVAPIVVWTSLAMPGYVAAEALLAYLGIGVVGIPSLGQTINRAQDFYSSYPLYLWAPVVTLMLLVVALNLLGDAVRDAFDPKTRR